MTKDQLETLENNDANLIIEISDDMNKKIEEIKIVGKPSLQRKVILIDFKKIEYNNANWRKLAKIIKGEEIKTIGELAQLLSSPTKPSISKLHLKTRKLFLEEIELSFLDKTGEIRKQIDENEIRMANLNNFTKRKVILDSIKLKKIDDKQKEKLVNQLNTAISLSLRWRKIHNVTDPIADLDNIREIIQPFTIKEIASSVKSSRKLFDDLKANFKNPREITKTKLKDLKNILSISDGEAELILELSKKSSTNSLNKIKTLEESKFEKSINNLNLTPKKIEAIKTSGARMLRDFLNPIVNNKLKKNRDLDKDDLLLLKKVGIFSYLSNDESCIIKAADKYSDIRAIAKADFNKIRDSLNIDEQSALNVLNNAKLLNSYINQIIVNSKINEQHKLSPWLYPKETETESRILRNTASLIPDDPCISCQLYLSISSPGAYMIDLLDFIQDTFTTRTQEILLKDIEDRLLQNIESIQIDYDNTNTKFPYIKFTNDILINLIAERQGNDWRNLDINDIDQIYDRIRVLPSDGLLVPNAIYLAFNSYLNDLGTTHDEIVNVLALSNAEKTAFAEEHGIEVSDLNFLNKDEASVLFSHLDGIYEILKKSKTNLLKKSLIEAHYQITFATILSEKITLLDPNDPNYENNLQTAEQEANDIATQAIANSDTLATLEIQAIQESTLASEIVKSEILKMCYPNLRNGLVVLAIQEINAHPIEDFLITSKEHLSEFMLINLDIKCCHETTLIAFIIERLQGLILSYQMGNEPRIIGVDFNHRRWAWMKSYGIWHAIQMIFFYPEDFLFPYFRKYEIGWTDFFEEMVKEIEDQGGVNSIKTAQKALDSFGNKIQDLMGAQVTHTVQVDKLLYLFTQGFKTNAIYYSTIDRLSGDPQWDEHYSLWENIEEWSGWKKISEEITGKLREGIQDVIYMDGILSIFCLGQEKFAGKVINQNKDGSFTASDFGEDINFIRIQPYKYESQTMGTTVWKANVYTRPRYHPSERANTGRVYDMWSFSKGQIGEELDIKLITRKSTEYLISLEHDMLYGWGRQVTFDEETKKIAIYFYVTAYLGLIDPILEIQTNSSLRDIKVNILSRGQTEIYMFYKYDNNDSRFIQFLDNGDIRHEITMNDDLPDDLKNTSFKCAGWYYDNIYFVTADYFCEFYKKYLPYPIYRVLGQLTLKYRHSYNRIDLEGLQAYENRDDYMFSQRSDFNYFDYPGMAREYLEEYYLHAPLYIASLLREEEKNEAAQYVYMTVFNPLTGDPLQQNMFLYQDFQDEWVNGPYFNLRNHSDYLLNPLTPFTIAKNRPFAFQRYVIFQYLENLLDWADAEFTRDTPRSVAIANDLYELAKKILKIETLPGELCEAGYSELIMKLLKGTRLENRGVWEEELIGIRKLLDIGGSKQKTSDTIKKISQIITMDKSEYKKFSKLNELRIKLEKDVRKKESQRKISVGAIINTSNQYFQNNHKTIEDIILNEIKYPYFEDHTIALQTSIRYLEYELVEVPDFYSKGFCIPPNPMENLLKFRIDSNIDKINNCRNFAGIQRELTTYETPVDPTDLLNTVYGGGDLEDFIPNEPPPLYRYSFLIERARYLTSEAERLEQYLLSTLEKIDAIDYTVLQAKNDLKLARENVALQGLRVQNAAKSVQLAIAQKDRAEISVDYYSDLLERGLSALEILSLSFMISAAASHAVASGLAFSALQASTGTAEIAATLSTTASVFSQWAGYLRRAEEWRHLLALSSKDMEIGLITIDIAEGEKEILQKERDIAQLSADLTSDTIEFLTTKQFTGPEFYKWMKSGLRRLLKRHLNLAIATARIAQKALSFELQEPLNYIGSMYWEDKREGILSASRLHYDLEKLDQHRLERASRRRELEKNISLATMMPAEFQLFRQTGILDFATLFEWFDRDSPGLYMRLIKSVEISVYALVPPIAGINATLTNHGTSRVMTGPPFIEPQILQRQPESVSLSQSQHASGLFRLELDDPMLLPFEGSGIDTTWTLSMPLGANQFNFNTITDIIMTIRYTAKHDGSFQQKIINELSSSSEKNQFLHSISIRYVFPDTWYHFHNPMFIEDPANYNHSSGNIPPYELQFVINEEDFRPNERDIKIQRIIIATEQSEYFDVPVNVRFKPKAGVVEIPINNQKVERGRLSLIHFKDQKPFGTWTIKFNNNAPEADYPDFFSNKEVILGQNKISTDFLKNIIFIIEYNSRLLFFV